jgi:hypothetical protein
MEDLNSAGLGAEQVSSELGGGGGNVPSTPQTEGASAPSGGMPSPEQLYDVKVDGKTLKVGLQELLNGYSRTQSYTQKMQGLSAREKEWIQRISNYEKAFQETRGLLSDRNRLAQILSQMPSDNPEDGDELLTKSQVEQMRQKWFEEYEQRQTEQAEASRYRAEVSSLKQQFIGELLDVYDSMSEQFPDLKDLPLFDPLRKKVGEYEPQSIADAKALLADEIKSLAKRKGWTPGGASAASQDGLFGIEPPGGAGPMPEAGQKFRSVRDPGLKNAVLADIEQMMRASLQS